MRANVSSWPEAAQVAYWDAVDEADEQGLSDEEAHRAGCEAALVAVRELLGGGGGGGAPAQAVA